MASNSDIRKLLANLCQQLNQASDIAANARAVVELDQQSVGRLSRQDALQQQAMAKAQERLRVMEMTRIDKTLQRLDQDDYGYCLECGDEIAAKRLAVDLMAELCIKCKARAGAS